MKYLSLFSGIEAVSQAWEELGWEPVAFCEIDRFPSAVLEHHYPDIPNLTDVSKITKETIEELDDIDLVVGGSPCQAFSVAGLRKGLADPRGNLTLEFLRVVSLVNPKWVLWENVPGVLSDDTGALLQLMNGLNELGYHVDLTERDAQYFGVPQRRRRIFLVCKRSDLDKSMVEENITNVEIVSKLLLGVLGEHLSDLGMVANKSLLSDVTMTPMREMVSSLSYDIKDWMRKVEEEYSEGESSVDDDLFGSLFEEEKTVEQPFIYNFIDNVLSDDSYNISMEEVTKCTTYLTNICNYVRSNEEIQENLLNEESLFSTAVQEYTKYAKKSTSESYVKKYSDSPINNISAISKENFKTFTDFGDWASRSEVHTEQESMQRDSVTGRTEGEKTSGNAANCFREGSFGQYIEGEIGTLKASGGVLGGGSETFISEAYTIIGDATPKISKDISGTLRADGGGGIVPPSVVYPINDKATRFDGNTGKGSGNGLGIGDEGDPSPTLTTGDHHSVCYSFDALSSNSMKSSNPLSGCREVDISTCLDTTTPNPSKNQGGMAVLSLNSKQQSMTCCEDIASTLLSTDYKEPQVIAVHSRQDPVTSEDTVFALDSSLPVSNTVAIQGSMIGRSDTAGPQGSGVDENVCFTLNTADRHAVAFEETITNAIAFEPGWAQREGSSSRFSEEVTSTVCSNMGDNQIAAAFLAENSATAGSIGYEVEKSPTLKSSGIPTIAFTQNDGGRDATEELSPTLRSGGDGGIPQMAVASFTEIADCLTARYYKNWNGNSANTTGSLLVKSETIIGDEPVVFQQNARDEVRLMGGDGRYAGALSANSGAHQTNYIASIACDVYNQTITGDTASSLTTASGMSNGSGPKVLNTHVRRLTPIECERLQGFPDNWTKIPYRNKTVEDCPAGPRYKAIGNSMAVPVMKWLAEQIIKSEKDASSS